MRNMTLRNEARMRLFRPRNDIVGVKAMIFERAGAIKTTSDERNDHDQCTQERSLMLQKPPRHQRLQLRLVRAVKPGQLPRVDVKDGDELQAQRVNEGGAKGEALQNG